jgi:hypothetical protein
LWRLPALRDNAASEAVIESGMTIRRSIAIFIATIAVVLAAAIGVAATAGPALANESSTNGA